MKYKLSSAIIAGVLALSSGMSLAADRAQAQDDTQAKERAQYVQTKLTEGIVSVVSIGIGQQKIREYQDQKVEYLHRVEANEYSLNRMNASDEPLIEWLETHNKAVDRLWMRETSLMHEINRATKRLGWISKSEHPEQYAKLENEIRSLMGELEKIGSQEKIPEGRIKALAVWARTGQGDIHLTAQERKSIKAFYEMKRPMIVENKELAKKVTVTELKSVAALVAYVPAAILVGATVNDMVTSSKRMEKAQASSQSNEPSSSSPARNSQTVTSRAAR